MKKYGNGKCYKLTNTVDNEIYVGSTIVTLKARKARHISASKLKPNIKVYNHLNKIGWDNVSIELIEVYPCKTVKELEDRETYWVRELGAGLNKKMPRRTRAQYYIDNKKKEIAYHKQYVQRNKEKISAYSKKYRLDHRDKLLARQKKWYQKNNGLEKVICECGSIIAKRTLKSHKRRPKHKKLMAVLEILC